MRIYKIDFENRIYTMAIESSDKVNDKIEVKLVMYNTTYLLYKDISSNTWHNHNSNFQLSKGLLHVVGAKLDEVLAH